MKQFFSKFQEVLVWIIVVLGLFATGYGVYFQTMGPYPDGTTPFYYVSLFYCLLGVAVGISGGYILTKYMEDSITSGKAGAMASKKGLASVIRGNVICYFLCLLVLYLASGYLAFFLGLAGSIFAWASLLYHQVYTILKEKGKLHLISEEKK